MSPEDQNIFISYSRVDSEFVLKLARDLHSANMRTWLDQLSVVPSKEWDDAVEKAIESCKSFLIVLSPTSIKSQDVKDELAFAIKQHKQIIPVLYKSCKIPFRIQRRQYCDFTTSYSTGFSQVQKALEIDNQSLLQKIADEGKTRESLEGVNNRGFGKLYSWVSSKSTWAKTVLGVVLITLVLFTTKLAFFSESLKSLSNGISGTENTTSIIPLSLSYEIEDSFGRRTGKLGDALFSGDHIYISFVTGVPCWATVFGVDSKDIYPVFRNKLEPSLIEKQQFYMLDFSLDETVGNEIYYAIAAHDRFDFERDIEPYLNNIFPNGNSKGPKFSEYYLNLPDNYTQKLIYFSHLSR